MWSLAKEENTAPEFEIRNLKLKGQSADSLMGRHGGELLLESTKSALQSTDLGIIFVKTMVSSGVRSKLKVCVCVLGGERGWSRLVRNLDKKKKRGIMSNFAKNGRG